MFIRINELSPTAHSATQLGTTLLGTRATFLTDISDYSNRADARGNDDEQLEPGGYSESCHFRATEQPHARGERADLPNGRARAGSSSGSN